MNRRLDALVSNMYNLKKQSIFNRVATSLRDTSAAAKVVEFSILEFPSRTHMSAVEVDGGGGGGPLRTLF
jgi:hypothetical protein